MPADSTIHHFTDRVLRPKQVFGPQSKSGLSRAQGYALIASGAFPAPFSLSKGCVGWRESTIDKWIADREVAAAAEAQ